MFILETHGLRKKFGEGETAVEAVRGIDLRVHPGEFLAIMGRSGSGKSTLLAMLGGVDVPTAGEVLIEGKNMAQMSDDERTLMRRRRIGFIFQSFNLLPILTAEENVALPLELDGVPPKEAYSRANAALEQVGMTARKGHLPSKMSGGEQQRVAIARALVIEPALLLADEPTGNLDSSNSKRITALLRELVDVRKQTIVMVTHDPTVATLADRVVHVVDGLINREEFPEPAQREAALAGRR
jgi:putative ABC transport system ATP-binding protein